MIAEYGGKNAHPPTPSPSFSFCSSVSRPSRSLLAQKSSADGTSLFCLTSPSSSAVFYSPLQQTILKGTPVGAIAGEYDEYSAYPTLGGYGPYWNPSTLAGPIPTPTAYPALSSTDVYALTTTSVAIAVATGTETVPSSPGSATTTTTLQPT